MKTKLTALLALLCCLGLAAPMTGCTTRGDDDDTSDDDDSSSSDDDDSAA